MANTKKYVSLDKLGLYDDKIKDLISKADAQGLTDAKAYADSLAKNYEAAGAAATAAAGALADAKKYTDEEINGLASWVSDTVYAEATAAKGLAGTALKNAGQAQALANNAMSKANNVGDYVGTFTTDDVNIKTVVEYIDAKTSGIASDETVSALDARIAVVEGDYLKKADKEELAGDIADAVAAVEAEAARADIAEKANAAAIKAIADDYLKAADKAELAKAVEDEAARAAGIEAGLAGRIKAIEDDYLKAADKTELQDNIDTLTGVVETLRDGIDAEKVDGVKDLITYVEEHGTEVTGIKEDIAKNAEAIAENAEAIAANAKAVEDEAKARAKADEALGGRVAVLEAINHEAYVAADTALENKLNGEIAKKADASALTQALEAQAQKDSAQDGKIAALEAKFTGEGETVEDMIATAKQEAIDAAAGDATQKANDAKAAAEAAAKTYADGLNTAMDTRVDALEAASETHALAADLTALAGRVTTAEGEIDTLQSEMDAVEALAAANKAAHEANTAAIALKAAQADLEAVSGRVTTLETWHSNFVECSQEDINGLFA